MDRRTLAVLTLAGAALAVLLAPSSAADPLGDGAPRSKGVDRNPANLLPAFRARLERVFAALRARGFDPYLFEGYRSPERAAALVAAGTHKAIKNSLHILGAAADVVDAKALWAAPPGFWQALREEAEREGLTSGASFGDPDHVQAVAVAEQDGLRAAADKNAFVASKLA